MRPLSRIASGGELSRIMLSIKNILASTDSVGTLIFDEIDTGVSGRAAGKIAEKLKEMANDRQVVAVTHLPQLAALAHNHFLIEKNTDDEKTFTDVRLLDTEGRVDEVARIIGGENISQTVKDTARELLGFNK
jgi:DNA repair protein RecN (Recombination protein N)